MRNSRPSKERYSHALFDRCFSRKYCNHHSNNKRPGPEQRFKPRPICAGQPNEAYVKWPAARTRHRATAWTESSAKMVDTCSRLQPVPVGASLSPDYCRRPIWVVDAFARCTMPQPIWRRPDPTYHNLSPPIIIWGILIISPAAS